MSNALTFRRGTGHIPNHPSRRPASVRSHPVHGPIVADTSPLPSSTSNRQFACAILDQKQTGECEAHTEAEGVYCSLALKGARLPWIPSVTAIYQLANGLMRAAYNPGVEPVQLPALEDGGLEPVFATAAVAKYGIVQTLATNGLSDADPDTAAGEADAVTVVAGATRIVRGTSSVDLLPGPERRDALKRLLAAGKPVKIALYAAGDAFQSYGPDSPPLSAPTPNPGSDHALLLVDYIVDENGTVTWIFQNHWSMAWGKGGWGECDDSFVDTFTDLEVVDAEVVA